MALNPSARLTFQRLSITARSTEIIGREHQLGGRHGSKSGLTLRRSVQEPKRRIVPWRGLSSAKTLDDCEITSLPWSHQHSGITGAHAAIPQALLWNASSPLSRASKPPPRKPGVTPITCRGETAPSAAEPRHFDRLFWVVARRVWAS